MNTIATTEPADVGAALSLEQVKRQVNLVQSIMRDVMKVDEHYGTIPGCGTKPALMKAGAEKLCFTFQLVPSFVVERTDFDNGHREYHITCRLANRAGQLIAEGVGCCSSMEPKYRYRNAGRKCPVCGKETIIKGKAEYGGGWLCFPKKGGCGEKWNDGAAAIEKQEAGKVENPDPAECFNTILKMAKKRAQVDATITATAASDIFTQDIDENLAAADDEKAKAQQAAPAEAPRPTPAAAAPKPAAASSQSAPPATNAKSATATTTAATGDGLAACKAAFSELSQAIYGKREPNRKGDIALMVWWGLHPTPVERLAALTAAVDDVRHVMSAIGEASGFELIADLADQHGFPGVVQSASAKLPATNAEPRRQCQEFIADLHAAANGEVRDASTTTAKE